MKATVAHYKLAKKHLHVNYVVTKKVRRGLYFIEIDFGGRFRPDCSGYGDSSLLVCADSELEVQGYIEVRFELPADMERNCIFGATTKTTWRGFMVATALYDTFHGPKSAEGLIETAWRADTNKTKRIR